MIRLCLHIILCGPIICCGEESALPEKLEPGKIDSSVLDVRLCAISQDPDIFRALDQPKNFISDDGYQESLRGSLYMPGELFPQYFSREPNRMQFSVCATDKRVFFWLPLQDRDILGWAPCRRPGQVFQDDDYMVMWVVLRHSQQTAAPADYGRTVSELRSSVADLVLLGSALKCGDVASITMELKAENAGGTRRHRIIGCLSGNVLQMRVFLKPEGYYFAKVPSLLPVVKITSYPKFAWPPEGNSEPGANGNGAKLDGDREKDSNLQDQRVNRDK